VSLLLLVLNDHFLKGGGLLPGWLTGKLSDVAGLVVAPVVLAVLLRTRSKVGFALCQASAAMFLGALQVSPLFAEAWSAMFAWLGIGWHTTPDPTDMIAFVVLPLAWRILVPVMAARVAHHAPRRVAEVLLFPTAAVFLMATSPTPCADLFESSEERPLTAAPAFGNELSGDELLARVANPQGLPFTYGPLNDDPACDAIRGRANTAIVVTYSVDNGVAIHDTLEVRPTPEGKGCGENYTSGTRVSVRTTASFVTSDGVIDLTGTVTLYQFEGSTSTELGWTREDGQIDTLAAQLGVPAQDLVGIEGSIYQEENEIIGEIRVFVDGGGESSISCTLGEWRFPE
jgi:hypothetical protein